MARQNIDNGDTGLEARTKINENDTELYDRPAGLWQIITNKLSNILQSVDYLSLFAKSVEVVRIGDGTNPKIIVDPSGTTGSTTGLWFGNSAKGVKIYELVSGILAYSAEDGVMYQDNNYLKGGNTRHFQIATNVAATATNPVYQLQSDSDTGMGSAGANQLSHIAGGVEVIRCTATGAYIQVIKSGADQTAAGANAGEMWKTSGHATLPDNVIMHGV